MTLNKILEPIKTTMLGGVVFLIPIILVFILLGKAFKVLKPLVEPISRLITVDNFFAFLITNVVTVLILLGICFLAGVMAKGGFGKKFSVALDEKLHSFFPKYAFIKSMTESFAGTQQESSLFPVLVHFDDLQQIAFEVERGKNGLVTLYLPGAPDPWAGSVIHVSEDRVTSLEADFGTVVKGLRHVGYDLNEIAKPSTDQG